MGSRYKCKPAAEAAKPALLGLLVAITVTVLLIAVFSLVFVIIEKIAESAIVPLALISAAVGTFAGALVCSAVTRCRGVVYGALIGLAVFIIIWLIGIFSSNTVFGTDSLIKFIVLTVSGAVGGWTGRNRRFSR